MSRKRLKTSYRIHHDRHVDRMHMCVYAGGEGRGSEDSPPSNHTLVCWCALPLKGDCYQVPGIPTDCWNLRNTYIKPSLTIVSEDLPWASEFYHGRTRWSSGHIGLSIEQNHISSFMYNVTSEEIMDHPLDQGKDSMGNYPSALKPWDAHSQLRLWKIGSAGASLNGCTNSLYTPRKQLHILTSRAVLTCEQGWVCNTLPVTLSFFIP